MGEKDAYDLITYLSLPITYFPCVIKIIKENNYYHNNKTSIFLSLIRFPFSKFLGHSKAKSSEMNPVPSVYISGFPSLYIGLPDSSCNFKTLIECHNKTDHKTYRNILLRVPGSTHLQLYRYLQRIDQF